MSQILKGENIAAEVLSHTGGAYAKRYFKIDTFKYSWIDLFLRDERLRKKIQTARSNIQEAQKLPIHKEELRSRFQSAIVSINNDRVSWFVEHLRGVQARQIFGLSSDTLRTKSYIPPIDLTDSDIAAIFEQLDEGVRQTDIDAKIKQYQKEIAAAEKVIACDLSPADRWIYEDDGKPVPYPQGCRWTQYVIAWRKVVARYSGPVSVEGTAIESDAEMTAYIALGLDKIERLTPLRTPYRESE